MTGEDLQIDAARKKMVLSGCWPDTSIGVRCPDNRTTPDGRHVLMSM